MSLLAQLQASGVLRMLDHALAQSLRRLDPDTSELVLAGAALASLAVAHGHAGLDPARPHLLGDAEVSWPDPAWWRQALQHARWIAQPIDPAVATPGEQPLVYEHGLLYLRRYREYERRLALGLQRLAAQSAPIGDPAALAAAFATLFPRVPDGCDRQACAAALALRRMLLMVTGGPGTGKTATIARLLVLRLALAAQGNAPVPRIALAAPTGRAAERMAESLRRAAAAIIALGVDPALVAHLPERASTLHRLLGTVPDRPVLHHHADNPLPYDVVVVDEASMVDLPLMCKLVEAIADGTQLILLGDPDQLPSVEAGDVLAAILAAAGPGDAWAPADIQALSPLLGGTAPRLADATGLAGHRVHLRRGYRQAQDFDLAPLAAAVRAGDADRSLALLRTGALRGVHFLEEADDVFLHGGHALLEHWRALADVCDPAEALLLAGRVRLLTAVREGAHGARSLNARIEELLGARRAGNDPGYFHGRLLLITENSQRHGLFNGDIGVCLRAQDGALWVWFSSEDGGVRAFHPATLPAHDSAFAMTVHKAQGAELDTVWVQLPRRDHRILSRELIYTALTRARRSVHLVCSEAVLRAALARRAARVSGLSWRLGG